MKKLVSILLMCGMVSTMAASNCFASDGSSNRAISKLADEVKAEKSAKTEAQNNYSDNEKISKPTEASQKEISETDAYFKKLAEKSGKPDDNLLKDKFAELKEKRSGVSFKSLKEFIKKHGLKVALAIGAGIAAVVGGLLLKKLSGSRGIPDANVDLVNQSNLNNVNNVFDDLEKEFLSEESSISDVDVASDFSAGGGDGQAQTSCRR